MKRILFTVVALCAAALFAEEQNINGQKWVCKDGLCMLVEETQSTNAAPAAAESAKDEASPVAGKQVVCEDGVCTLVDAAPAAEAAHEEASPIPGMKVVCEDGVCTLVEDTGASAAPKASAAPAAAPRIAHGYMEVDDFIAFLENAESKSLFDGKAWWLVVLLVLAGGLAMNLTPCVLPMIPINLMIIGRSAVRGTLYGAGIAVAYGALGILAAVGGMAFGVIQGNPWFNAAIALLFLVLALSMLGVFFIDFSKKRNNFASMRTSMWPGLFAFFMGMVSAVLAGACVAPILIAVLLLTADLFAKGVYMALALPLVMGVGMALPWPFAGAGLQVLPKPGAWMTKVNKIFGVLVLGFAAWYGYLSYKGFASAEPAAVESNAGVVKFASPAEFSLEGLKRPVVVDCWATWCKNCTAMEESTLADEKVKKALKDKGFTFVKLQAEDIGALKKLPGFEGVKGLPAFLIFE